MEITNNLVIDVNDPENENLIILKAVEAPSKRIQFVTETVSTLEDAYLKLVKERKKKWIYKLPGQ